MSRRSRAEDFEGRRGADPPPAHGAERERRLGASLAKAEVPTGNHGACAGSHKADGAAVVGPFEVGTPGSNCGITGEWLVWFNCPALPAPRPLHRRHRVLPV